MAEETTNGKGKKGGNPHLEPNDDLDVMFMRDMLVICLSSLERWVAAYGVKHTRQFVRYLLADALRKEGEPILPGITDRTPCSTCYTRYYTCPGVYCGNYAALTTCINGPCTMRLNQALEEAAQTESQSVKKAAPKPTAKPAPKPKK